MLKLPLTSFNYLIHIQGHTCERPLKCTLNSFYTLYKVHSLSHFLLTNSLSSLSNSNEKSTLFQSCTINNQYQHKFAISSLILDLLIIINNQSKLISSSLNLHPILVLTSRSFNFRTQREISTRNLELIAFN